MRRARRAAPRLTLLAKKRANLSEIVPRALGFDATSPTTEARAVCLMSFERLPADVVALIVHYEPAPARLLCRALRAIADERAGAVLGVARQHIGAVLPAVSYTHLTLPTKA